MSLPITDAMQQAQDAISGGNYRAAVATCTRLVKQYPAYAAAQRLLGEAYLEQGQSAEAERAFTAALSANPRQPFAYLGLGLLAEDRGATDSALAYCQVAWELSPQLAQLREPVARVSARRYGADGELHLTRAALAQLHADASRLRRAVSEYRAALAELPERIDLKLGLAEALWRLGQNDEAAGLAGQALEQLPDAVQALIILADIEQRGGNAQHAGELRARLRAVDPDGAAVEALLAGHASADRAFLLLPADETPLLAEQEDAVVAERPHIAPAPDFEYTPTRQEAAPLPDLDDLEPISAAEFGAPADAPAVDDTAESFDDLDASLAGLEPFLVDVEPAASETPTLFAMPENVTADAPTAANAPDEALTDLGALGFEDFSEEPFDPNETLPSFSTPSQSAPLADVVMDDDLSALAAALEGDIAGAVSRAAEPSASEPLAPFSLADLEQPAADAEAAAPAENFASLDAALPAAEPPRGYTTVLRELDSAGIAPFDALGRAGDELPPAAQATPPLDAADELARMNQQWDTIDAEIENAVPWDETHGFTDQLRSLEEIGLAPFEFEDDAPAADAPTLMAPAAPETADTSLPSFEELLAAPDESEADAADAVVAEAPAPLFDLPEPDALVVEPAEELAEPEAEHVAEPVAEPAEEPASVAADAAPDALDDDALLGGLEPFVFDDEGVGEASAATSRLAWDASGLKSAVPSDADLEALLAVEDEPFALDDAPRSEDDGDRSMLATANLAPQDADTTEDQAAPEAAAAEAQAAEVDELAAFFESSTAATRALPDAGQDTVVAFTPSFTDEPELPGPTTAEPVSPEPHAEPADFADGLYDRARANKEQLVADGVISGDRELGAAEAEDIVAEAESEPLSAEAVDDSEDLEADYQPLTTGASRDTATLRAALQADPNDAELRWWLAEALRERGEVADAQTEYRWLIRNAPERYDAVQRALHECVERGQQAEMAHRLLADLYRRRGDAARASNHAALALQQRQRAARG